MNEKLVLPRFSMPRDATRSAMRALWVAGGMVVVATLVLGMAVWHRRSVELATVEQASAKAAAARRAAMAPAAPTAMPAPKAATQRGALVGMPETTLAAVVPAASETPSPTPHRSASRARHGKASHARAAHAAASDSRSAPAKSAGKKTKVDDDFIDSLLKK